MKKLSALAFLALTLVLSGCGGPTGGSTVSTGEISAEEKAKIAAEDKAVADAEAAHSSGK